MKNPKKEGLDNIKKIKINKKNVKKNRLDTKARVDKHPLVSYIERMKGKNAGELTVYIDAMDGLTDPPMVRAWIPGRKDREINLK